jgi:hypothetical protein
MLNVFQQWEQARNKREFCDRFQVQDTSLRFVNGKRRKLHRRQRRKGGPSRFFVRVCVCVCLVADIRRQLLDQLKQANLVHKDVSSERQQKNPLSNRGAKLTVPSLCVSLMQANAHKSSWPVVTAALCAGLFPNIAKKNKTASKIKS